MEPSRRNQWQPPANRPDAETAETSQICCPGLRLVAAAANGKEGSTVRVRQRASTKCLQIGISSRLSMQRAGTPRVHLR
jgi:hypothetical protein